MVNTINILLVEDEPKVASFIKRGLEEHGFEVELAYDGFVGRRLALNNTYDVIILDVNLPQINGFELCREIRRLNPKTPIVMLTALGTTEDKLTGFDVGADDYIVKPFEFRELLARVRALLKRSHYHGVASKLLKVADLEIDTDSKAVKRAGQTIELTAKEYLLLEYLVKNKGRVVSRMDIAEKIWDITFDTGTNVIDVYVNFLRKKIDKNFSPKLIHTQIGMGYILKEGEST
jgi:two-component system, OmpR family, copper resistance phosphate regulon response regulator CusR